MRALNLTQASSCECLKLKYRKNFPDSLSLSLYIYALVFLSLSIHNNNNGINDESSSSSLSSDRRHHDRLQTKSFVLPLLLLLFLAIDLINIHHSFIINIYIHINRTCFFLILCLKFCFSNGL